MYALRQTVYPGYRAVEWEKEEPDTTDSDREVPPVFPPPPLENAKKQRKCKTGFEKDQKKYDKLFEYMYVRG